MAEQNESQPQLGGSAGDNPDAGSWVEPESARNPLAEALPTETDQIDSQQLYIDERLQALREEGLVDTSAESDQAEVAEKGPASAKEKGKSEKEEDKPAKEDIEPAIVRLMERETKLREARKQFEVKQREYEEYQRKVELAQRDPIEFLKAHGLVSEDQLLDLAKAAYYETDPDSRPQDYTVNKKIQALEQELQALKSGKQEESQAAQQERLLNEYRSKLVNAYTSADKDQYPLVGKIEQAYGTEAVHYDLMQAAEYFAQHNEGKVPTEAEAITTLNTLYEQKFGKLLNATQNEPARVQEAAPVKRTTTLKNSQTKAYREPEGLEAYRDAHGDPEAYQKVSKLSRAHFQQWIKQRSFNKP